jgi:hypothetical protein
LAEYRQDFFPVTDESIHLLKEACFFGEAISEFSAWCDVSRWNTSAVTNLDYFFAGMDSSMIGNLSTWDLSSVTSMEFMFEGVTDFDQDLCCWTRFSNVASIIDQSGLDSPPSTENCSSVDSCGLPPIFVDSELIDMNDESVMRVIGYCMDPYMAGLFTDVCDYSRWNITSVTDLTNLFSTLEDISSLPDISDWDLSSVTTLEGMFGLDNYDGTYSPRNVNQDLCCWLRYPIAVESLASSAGIANPPTNETCPAVEDMVCGAGSSPVEETPAPTKETPVPTEEIAVPSPTSPAPTQLSFDDWLAELKRKRRR